jgi:hypothetical protein
MSVYDCSFRLHLCACYWDLGCLKGTIARNIKIWLHLHIISASSSMSHLSPLYLSCVSHLFPYFYLQSFPHKLTNGFNYQNKTKSNTKMTNKEPCLYMAMMALTINSQILRRPTSVNSSNLLDAFPHPSTESSCHSRYHLHLSSIPKSQ